MPALPLVRATNPGLYQALTTANTDVVVTVPAGATAVVLWFEASAADSTFVGGRVGIDQANTAVTPITHTNTALAYHPPMPVEYDLQDAIGRFVNGQWETTSRDAYLHLASNTANAVVRGMWLFNADA